MKYAATAAQTIIPYALYEGAQGSLYRDFVFDGQAHLPSDAPLYSRPALTTLNYDRAFGSGRTCTLWFFLYWFFNFVLQKLNFPSGPWSRLP